MSEELKVSLMAEEGAALSSGALRLYATAPHSDYCPQPSTLNPPTTDLLVGCVDLYAYDPVNRRCAVGVMVANEHRRQGYATAMLQALSLLAADTYHLHTLYADIAATNRASLALFGKAGYTECGHFSDWLVVGDRYVDSIRMQILL